MRIYQASSFLYDLIRQVRKGSLLPAAFQRPYVWSQKDVLALVESILRGYPIGGFLTWTPNGKADLSGLSRGRLGPIYGTDDVMRTSLLLDGQNRLASLAWIARDTSQPLPDDVTEQELATWPQDERLIADLATQTIKFVPLAEAEVGYRLPAAALLSNPLANEIFRARWDEWEKLGESATTIGMRWFDDTASAFREARVVVTEIADASPEEAKHAFLHICKVGVPMSEQDFAKALAWTTITPAPAESAPGENNKEAS
jgi:hypothetical protein